MSIDALQLLVVQIVTEVQTLALPPQSKGSQYDLLQSLYAAFGQGLAIVAGFMNAVAPINRVPPELLATIFALSPGRHSPGSQLPYWPFTEPCVNDLHKLPKVCRYWRELALGTPTLWNYVVTFPHSQGRDSCFGRSIYLPDDAPVDLNVHFNPRINSKTSVEKMTEFMLTNAPRIRELHTWDASSIVDLQLFFESFDANALEHCTISERTFFDVPIGIPYPPGRRLFFSGGGGRLRSLCLNDLQFLPENAFPALALLKIGFIRRRSTSLCWSIEDLVKFLAGSPKLEEVYVHDVPYSERNMWDKSPPVSLSRLQYLAFTYSIDVICENPAHPADLLLARISIPPTCHMYLPTPNISKQNLTKTTSDILTTVCRHVPGTDAVSHVLLQLTRLSTTLQLVFRCGGSLRLDIPGLNGVPTSGAGSLPCGDVLRAFAPGLLTGAQELRVHYDDGGDPAVAVLAALPLAAFFPTVRALSIIRTGAGAGDSDEDMLWAMNPRASLRVGLALLRQLPPPPPARDAHSASPSPFPALGTLWVSVESRDEIAELKAALAARAALGLPIRCLVVTVRYSVGADADDVARLQALDAEEVVVMDKEYPGALGEVDWLVRLPERYDLPSSIYRDWPTVWGRQKQVPGRVESMGGF